MLYKKKKNLQLSKNKAITKVYSGLLADKPIKTIHKELAMIINDKKQLDYFKKASSILSKRIEKVRRDQKNGYFYDLKGNKINNITDIAKNEKDYISLFLINTIVKKGNWSYSSEKIQNQVVRENESEAKKAILEEQFKDTSKVFFVCSKHADSAKDHKNYQGKIYYNANYDKRDERITAYIKRYNLTSVQEITGDPVYLITRPHCRHYFKHYTYEEVASGMYYVPTRKIGSRKLSTKREKSVEETIQYYKNRLATLEELNKVHSNYMLRVDIQKCRDLIAKWKKEL